MKTVNERMTQALLGRAVCIYIFKYERDFIDRETSYNVNDISNIHATWSIRCLKSKFSRWRSHSNLMISNAKWSN